MGKNTKIPKKIDKAKDASDKSIDVNLPQIDWYTYTKLARANKDEILLWIREHLMSSETYSKLHEHTASGRTRFVGLPNLPKMRTNVPGGEGFLYVRYYDYGNREMVQKSLDKHIEDCTIPMGETDQFWWLNHKSWKEIFSKVLAIFERQIHLRAGERVMKDLHNTLTNWHSTKNKFHLGSSYSDVEFQALSLIGHTTNAINTIGNSDANEVLLRLVRLGLNHNTKLKQDKRMKKP